MIATFKKQDFMYYKKNAISNSFLSQSTLKGDEPFLKFGSAFDALLTEPEIIKEIQNKLGNWDLELQNDEGNWEPIDAEMSEKIYKMKESFEANDTVKKILATNPDGQVEAYQYLNLRTFTFHKEKRSGFYATKCKLDWYTDKAIIDIKTTASANLKSFLSGSFEKFGYHRQAFWYLEHFPKINFFYFLCVSKKEPHRTFVHVIKRGDATWQKARKEVWTKLNSLNIEKFRII